MNTWMMPKITVEGFVPNEYCTSCSPVTPKTVGQYIYWDLKPPGDEVNVFDGNVERATEYGENHYTNPGGNYYIGGVYYYKQGQVFYNVPVYQLSPQAYDAGYRSAQSGSAYDSTVYYKGNYIPQFESLGSYTLYVNGKNSISFYLSSSTVVDGGVVRS